MVLGITCYSEEYMLVFQIDDIINTTLQNSVMKRLALKAVASIYDLFGVMSPAVVKLKSLFQDICMIKCDWDAPLSDKFVDKWRNVLCSLKYIGIISVPRHYLWQLDI